MKFTFNDLGRQITNPVIGLYLDSPLVGVYTGISVLPINSKGEILELNYEEEKVTVIWNIGNKNAHSYFTFSQFEQLIEAGILCDLEKHIVQPEPKFEVGDLVKGSTVTGIIKSRRFDGLKNAWNYTLINLEEVFSDDYDLRHDIEEEKYITKLDGVVKAEIEFKSDKVYELSITEKIK